MIGYVRPIVLNRPTLSKQPYPNLPVAHVEQHHIRRADELRALVVKRKIRRSDARAEVVCHVLWRRLRKIKPAQFEFVALDVRDYWH